MKDMDLLISVEIIHKSLTSISWHVTILQEILSFMLLFSSKRGEETGSKQQVEDDEREKFLYARTTYRTSP